MATSNKENAMLKYGFVNSVSTLPSQVTGNALAYYLRGKTTEQRAVLAAAEFDAVALTLTEPTDVQLCALFNISRYQLNQARKLSSHERWRVKAGFRHHLGDKIGRLTETVRVCGPDAAWDAILANLN
jgi:hypothetical protein